MKIRWIQSVELEVFTSYDDLDDTGDTELVSFDQDETIEIDILNEAKGTVDMQFGDGSVALTVNRDCFEEVL